MQVCVHELEHKVNVSVVVGLQYVPQLDDILVVVQFLSPPSTFSLKITSQRRPSPRHARFGSTRAPQQATGNQARISTAPLPHWLPRTHTNNAAATQGQPAALAGRQTSKAAGRRAQRKQTRARSTSIASARRLLTTCQRAPPNHLPLSPPNHVQLPAVGSTSHSNHSNPQSLPFFHHRKQRWR